RRTPHVTRVSRPCLEPVRHGRRFRLQLVVAARPSRRSPSAAALMDDQMIGCSVDETIDSSPLPTTVFDALGPSHPAINSRRSAIRAKLVVSHYWGTGVART